MIAAANGFRECLANRSSLDSHYSTTSLRLSSAAQSGVTRRRGILIDPCDDRFDGVLVFFTLYSIFLWSSRFSCEFFQQRRKFVPIAFVDAIWLRLQSSSAVVVIVQFCSDGDAHRPNGRHLPVQNGPTRVCGDATVRRLFDV